MNCLLKIVNDLRSDENKSEIWREFKRNYKIYEADTQLVTKSDEVRVAALLSTIGDQADYFFHVFKLTDDERKNYETVMKAFDDHYYRNNRVLNARFKFFSRNQNEDEAFDLFSMDIKTLAETCEFGDQKTLLIRDRIVSGMLDKKLQEKLLREDNLSYDRALEICRAADAQEEIEDTMASNMNKSALPNIAGTEHDSEQSIEGSLLQLDESIKSCIQLKSADLDQAIKLLLTYKSIKYTKNLLIKHPFLVNTMRRLRKYVGNDKSWALTDQQKAEFREKVEGVRNLAGSIFDSFKSFFDVPKGKTFNDMFDEEVRLSKERDCHIMSIA